MREDHISWYEKNLQILLRYPDLKRFKFYMGEKPSLVFFNFTLPGNFRQLTTKLMIVFPSGQKIFYQQPDRFYLNMGLLLREGNKPGHIFMPAGFNDLQHKGWARFSLHLNRWCPTIDVVSGTNIHDILEAIYNGLKAL